MFVNFSHSVTLMFHQCALRFEWILPLPMRDFVTPCIGHLENSASLGFTYLPNSDIFIIHYISKTSLHRVMLLLTSREKSL